MELPPKPELEWRERVGQFGEIVEELTPGSEALWSKYLTELQLAKAAIRRATNEEDHRLFD